MLMINDEVLGLKASAKDARKEGDWEGALDDLNEAIDILLERVPVGADNRGIPDSIASDIADTYGMIGGVERRWGLVLDGSGRAGHLEASVIAYDKGFEYERRLSSNDATTYNRINRLVGRVLIDPFILKVGRDLSVNFFRELKRAEKLVMEQLDSFRMRDPWAYCDLAVIQLLRGSGSALASLNELDLIRPPVFVYESTLETLAPLSEIASVVRPELAEAVQRLKRSMRY